MNTEHIQRDLADAQRAAESLAAAHAADWIASVSNTLADSLKNGNKILACGNGGSAADAMHFAEELTGRYDADRPALAAIACTDPGHITCASNDFGYDTAFARWVEALGRPGDAIVLLTTSGNSKSILHASEAAAAIGMTRVALLGKTGGLMKDTCEHQWIAETEGAASPTARAQEIHMLILHAMIAQIERDLGHA